MTEIKTESKYERLRKIGTGSYGVVFKCINRQNGQIVAIKRYSENDSDPIIRKIAMREVRMLRQLKHPNLINLIEVFRRKRRLHLVFDYCELTVLDVIEKYNNNCPLNLIKKIIWQTVNGINYCHTHNCIHRDIKPENILINQAGVVKLCDFGFARNFALKPAHLGNNQDSTSSGGRLLLQNGINSLASKQQLQRKQNHDYNNALGDGNKENNKSTATSATTLESNCQALTEYVATRWYRAPELLIGEVYYDIKIDIWAIGCVAAELMRGEPVWPGKTDLDQLCLIESSLGQLTASQTHTLLTQSIYDQGNIERLLNQSANMSESIERKLPSRIGQSGIDFVSACLRMDPAKRPSSEELLKHVFIHSVRMTQFIKEANLSNSSRQLSATIRTPNSVALVKPSNYTTTTTQLPTITKSRSNSQALKMVTSNHNRLAATGDAPVSSGSTTNTTISSVLLPALQPSKRLIVAKNANSDQNQSTLQATLPVNVSSIPLPITKTPLPTHLDNKLRQQQQKQQQQKSLTKAPSRRQQQESSVDRIDTSPAKHKRKHPVNYNRTTVLDWS